LIAAYFKYLLRSGNHHSIHSPFVFDLYNQVIREKKDKHSDYENIGRLRKTMLSSRQEIEVLDLGAGSRINRSNLRQIRTIAKNAEKPAKFGRLFHRLVRRFEPKTIVELGTSLGLTTLYFAKAKKNANVISFEGCPATADIARQNFDHELVGNIEIILGNIDNTLPERLAKLNSGIDLLYVDANHRFEPTIRYFEQCMPFANENSVFIFDDIYWSDEMTQAWEHIKADPRVTVTIDLFWIGIVFFRQSQAKENFTLRF
jgi:predicted O-methyltransferase YrrM